MRERVPNILSPDAAARRQRRRLHQLPRQRRPSSSSSEAADGRHRPLPRLRLPELGREHARRRSTRCGEAGQARRRRDLLHRRHPGSRPRQIRARLLCRPGQGAGGGRLPHPRHQGHGGAAASRRRRRELVEALKRRGRPADPLPHPRHLGHRRRDACSPRSTPGSTRSTPPWIRCPASPRSPVSARWSRRCATPRATPASTPRRSARSRFYWEAVRAQYRAFESDLRERRLPRSICTRCPAASSPTCGAGALAGPRRRAGTRSPAPIARSTICSATSSR